MLGSLVPGWIRRYDRGWLRPDAIAGLIIWGVVTPQCVAYAQIAGLPPQAGLMAAPVAMIGYGLVGRSRSLVVSATTATSAISAAAIGPLAHGDMSRFLALSAALALVAGLVLILAGVVRIGGIADLISKPVMTGFLFGLGLTIIVSQLPAVFGVKSGSGNFFGQLGDLISHLGSTQIATLSVGVLSLIALLALGRLATRIPATIVVLAGGILVSALLHLDQHGVVTVGTIPTALPDPSIPNVSVNDLVTLVPTGFAVLILTTEAVGVARALASQEHQSLDPNRELMALGTANVLAGFSGGFVQSGGASQTAAAESAGGRSQLASVIAAGLVLLTGAFLSPLFKDLPKATLAAIVIVAVSGFLRVDELRRFARVYRSALVFSLLALVGVLTLGVLPGLIVTAALSLGRVITMLSRPGVGAIVRNPADGAWLSARRYPDMKRPAGVLVAAWAAPLFYANTAYVKEQLLALIAAAKPPVHAVVLDIRQNHLDLGSLDMLGELADQLAGDGVSLTLAQVGAPALALLRRGGLESRVRVAQSLDAAVAAAAGDQAR